MKIHNLTKTIFDSSIENSTGITVGELKLLLSTLESKWDKEVIEYFGCLGTTPICIKTSRGFHRIKLAHSKNLEHGIVFELDGESKFSDNVTEIQKHFETKLEEAHKQIVELERQAQELRNTINHDHTTSR